MRLRNTRYAAVVAVGALALSACSAGHPDKGSDSGAKATADTITVGSAADSKGPATPVTGARKGGTVYDLEQDGINHLDPAQAYTQATMIISQMFARTLTGYRIDPKTGKTTLVGDLATDTGEPSDGDRTWTFHLKPGLKWQDGTPITSDQVKYGFERLYANFETEGPTYVQSWLSGNDFRKAYQGPYGGKSLPDSVIGTPDSSTVVFHFQQPRTDAPYAMALPDAGPVLKAKDTKTGYDTAPFSDGPYKIGSYDPGKEMVLVRNTHWDPASDPIRQAYPDKWDFQLSISQLNLTQRLMAQSGQDKDALSLVTPADPSQTAVIATDASQYKSRLVSQYQPYVEVFNLNTSRIKDVRVRQAIAYAMPVKQVRAALGGGPQGDLGTSLIGPTNAGYAKSDPFGKEATPQGDPAKAKQLLAQAGVKHLTLTYAYRNQDRWQTVARTLQSALGKAGINLQLKAVDATSWYSQIAKVDNPYDIYASSWGADWPSASTIIPPTMDGRELADGSKDYSHLNDSHVNSEIDRISAITDLKQQSAQWQKLGTYIVQHDTPVVPYLYDKYYNVYGNGLGGVTYNTPIGTINPGSVYVK